MKKYIYNSNGFTMVETLITIAIISVIAAIGFPTILSTYNTTVVKRDARDIMAELSAARFRAIAKNKIYRVNFTLNTGSADQYQLLSCSSKNVCTTVSDKIQVSLAGAADLTSPASNFFVDFYPSGSSTSLSTNVPSDTQITLKNTKSNTYIYITIKGNTGSIKSS